MTVTAIDTRAAVEAAKTVTGILPEAGKIAVLESLLLEMSPEALKALSPDAQQKLQQALTGTEAAPSATTSAAGGRIEIVDGHQAVVGKITVNGQQLDTLLSEWSFKKNRSDQDEYAVKLGYRMATREEHLAYVEGLLAKEDNKTINEAEQNALKIYRERYVRDTQGGLVVVGRRVHVHGIGWYDVFGHPFSGALFVRASAESK